MLTKLNYSLIFAIWTFLQYSVGQEKLTSCQTRSNVLGYCSLLADCTTIKGQIIFQNMLNDVQCQNTGIQNALCCPYSNVSPDGFRQIISNDPQPGGTSSTIALRDRIGNDAEVVLNPVGVEILRRQRCGEPQTGRIANGERTQLNEFPWMALLKYGDRFLCGGSLITDRWVLTAAHCITPTLSHVRLGEYDISQEYDCKRAIGRRPARCWIAQDLAIERSVSHPNYTVNGYLKDIALIQLEEGVTFKENIKPVCLPTRPQHLSLPLVNGVVTLDQYRTEHGTLDNVPFVAGWGLTEIGYAENVLQKARLVSITSGFCAQLYKRSFNANSKMCAGVASNVTTCRGDSGGPLFWRAHYDETLSGSAVYRYVQVSLISVGAGKCGSATGLPALFENVVASMDWITEEISK